MGGEVTNRPTWTGCVRFPLLRGEARQHVQEDRTFISEHGQHVDRFNGLSFATHFGALAGPLRRLTAMSP
jgi:hypothetical protein